MQKAPAQLCKLIGRQLTSWLSRNLLQGHHFLCKLWPQRLPSRHMQVVRLPIFIGVPGGGPRRVSSMCIPPRALHATLLLPLGTIDGRRIELYIHMV